MVAVTTSGHCGKIPIVMGISRGRIYSTGGSFAFHDSLGRPRFRLGASPYERSGWPTQRPWDRTVRSISGQRDVGRYRALWSLLGRLERHSFLKTGSSTKTTIHDGGITRRGDACCPTSSPQACSQWRYSPTLISGRPVSRLSFFQLSEGKPAMGFPSLIRSLRTTETEVS
jgi:hypothetical protein